MPLLSLGRSMKLQSNDAPRAERHRRSNEPGAAGTRHTVREPNLQWMVASRREAGMRFVRSTLLWLVGIPLPIILLIALFLHPA
jgi:hypothetical protein